tara:strand:+ start:4213 stop:4881 length:669 start_codon:yes stop_codon:yes gene_type:complete
MIYIYKAFILDALDGPKMIIIKNNIMLKVFYDLETTGLNPKKNGIHQIAMLFELDDVVVEKLNFKVKPHPKAKIEDEALKVSGTTREDLLNYLPRDQVYTSIVTALRKYISPYDKRDKAHLIGFNNRSFDDDFFYAFFKQDKESIAGDPFFYAWFWMCPLDAIVLAHQYLIERRSNMPNFKLATVARELGIPVDDSRLHDGMYDVLLTREIYKIVVGLEIEV